MYCTYVSFPISDYLGAKMCILMPISFAYVVLSCLQCALFDVLNGKKYAIPKIKLLCNLRCLKARLSLLCNKLSMVQQPDPRFKTA